MNFCYPAEGINSLEDFYLKEKNRGFFPIGSFCLRSETKEIQGNTWHGGIHVEGENIKIRSIADGYIVAYRFPKQYETTGEGENLRRYSTGFVLIQHPYESLNGQKMTFYSVCHHLLPQDQYKAETEKPSFLSEYKSKAIVETKKGLQLWLDDKGVKSADKCILLPKGSIVKAKTDTNLTQSIGSYGTSYREVSYRKNDGTEVTGYMYFKDQEKDVAKNSVEVRDSSTKEYIITYDKDSTPAITDIALWENTDKRVILQMLKEGTEFTVLSVSKGMAKVKLKSGELSGYIPFDDSYMEKTGAWIEALCSEDESEERKTVNCKFPIKAGELLGFTGFYEGNGVKNYSASHIEVFTSAGKNELEKFLENEKDDGIHDGEVVFNPFVKVPETVTIAINTEKLLSDTELNFKEEKGDYYKVKIGSVQREVDRKNDLANTSYSNNKYTLTAAIPGIFGGILKTGDVLELMNTDTEIEAKKKNNDSKRDVKYDYPFTGKEFWIEKEELEKEGDSCKIKSSGTDPVELYLLEEYPEEGEDACNTDYLFVRKSDLKIEKSKNDDTLWYKVEKEYYDRKNIKRKVKGYFQPQNLISPYAWDTFGFECKKDDAAKDKVILDFETCTSLKDMWEMIDDPQEGEEKKILSDNEYKAAMNHAYKVQKISRVIYLHHNEWAYDSDSANQNLKTEWQNIYNAYIDNSDKNDKSKEELKKASEEIVNKLAEKAKKLSFWSEIQIAANDPDLEPFPSDPCVFHFHPIAFVEQMKRIPTWYEPVINPMATLYMQSGGENERYSTFGNTRKEMGRVHQGQDIFAVPETLIYACMDAVVHSVSSTAKGYGNQLVIRIKSTRDFIAHRRNYTPKYSSDGEISQGTGYNENGDIYLRYAHLKSVSVKKNDELRAGEIIGESGVSGVTDGTSGPHVHFEILNLTGTGGLNNRLNPAYYVNLKFKSDMTPDDITTQDNANKSPKCWKP